MLSVFDRNYNGRSIRIREDKYVCLTDMAVASGKRLNNWIQTDKSKSYLEALSSVAGIPVTELVEISQGGIPENQGTWGHPKVALRFAQWCSDEFAIQVDFWIDELMTTGTVSIAPQPLPRQLPPIRDTIEYIQASKDIADIVDPILKSYLLQSLYEDIGVSKALPPSDDVLVVAAVKARSLGYTLKPGEDSKLGKWVAKHCNPLGKTQHGRYEVNVYRDDDRLVETIGAFFS
jgi:hypothetical protein